MTDHDDTVGVLDDRYRGTQRRFSPPAECLQVSGHLGRVVNPGHGEDTALFIDAEHYQAPAGVRERRQRLPEIRRH